MTGLATFFATKGSFDSGSANNVLPPLRMTQVEPIGATHSPVVDERTGNHSSSSGKEQQVLRLRSSAVRTHSAQDDNRKEG